MDDVNFRRQLAETTRWWSLREQRGTPHENLRSAELAPTLGPHDEPMALWVTESMVRDVVHRRRSILATAIHPATPCDLRGGRLLLSAPEYTNHNALTMDLSDSFFDEHDVPPWDLWVGGFRGEMPAPDSADVWPPTLGTVLDGGAPPYLLLVAWVPPPYVDIVPQCIAAERVGLLAWLDQLQQPPGGGPDFSRVTPGWLTSAVHQGAAADLGIPPAKRSEPES